MKRSATLLLGKRFVRFDDRPRSLFEAKGAQLDSHWFEAINQLTNGDFFLDLVTHECPVVGETYQLEISDTGRPKYLFDTTVWFAEGCRSDATQVEVTSVFGRRAFCTPATESQLSKAATERCLALFSCENYSVLAERIDRLDCFIAVDFWPNEIVPMRFALDRKKQFRIQAEELALVELGDGGYSFSTNCSTCNGKEKATCRFCGGSALQKVVFKEAGFFSTTDLDERGRGSCRQVDFSSIQVRDSNRGVTSLSGSASQLIEQTVSHGSANFLSPPDRIRVRQEQLKFGQIRLCLQKSIAERETEPIKPIQIHTPQATLFRHQGKVAYEFKTTHIGKQFPLNDGSSLSFLTVDKQGDLIEFRANSKDDDVEQIGSEPAVLVTSRHLGQETFVTISFSVKILIEDLPADLHIQPLPLPPAEITQLRHLNEWSSPSQSSNLVVQAVTLPAPLRGDNDSATLFNQSIYQNAMQLQAVKHGVSEVPLSLIKGPPGTGKTTVIAELVRQAINKNERVLVCSKNHQAVRNVLEKLHVVGGIRMARHGRMKNLSELESRYAQGGVAEYFVNDVLSNSQSLALRIRNRLTELLQIHSRFLNALSASKQLHEIRTRCKLDREKEVWQRDSAILVQEEQRTQRLLVIESEANLEIKPARAALNTAKKQLGKAQKRLDRSNSKFAILRQRREIRFPDNENLVPRLTKWNGVLDSLTPYWFAGQKSTERRIKRIEIAFPELKSKLAESTSELRLATATVDSVERKTNAIKRSVEQSYAKILKSLKTNFDIFSTKLDNTLKSANQSFLPPQETAALDAIKFFPETTGDMKPETWEAADAYIQKMAQDSERRLKFVMRWISAVESSRKDIMQCYWDRLQVFFSTCVGVGSWKNLVQDDKTIDLVVIDEAATATVGETLVPMLYGDRVVLIGDEMQLPPMDEFRGKLCDDQCADTRLYSLTKNPGEQAKSSSPGVANSVTMSDCWLSRSLFEWLWKEKPHIARTMLNVQFRMHPEIAAFVGDVFYPEGLRTGVASSDRNLKFAEFNRPVCMIPTSAYQNRFEKSFSPGYDNELEARIVRHVIEKAESDLDSTATFGVITPYAKQVDNISDRMKDLLPRLRRASLTEDDIASVDSFQGGERDVIIISFVRSPLPCSACNGAKNPKVECDKCKGSGFTKKNLEFARDLQRLNVAFSRARKMLILVGDLEALSSPSHGGNEMGRRVLENFDKYVRNRGKVLHVWEKGYDE